MPTSCVFQLDRSNPVYRSGDCINGRILLKTDKVKRVNAVYVTLEGEAKVQWSISGKSETASYFGHQQYLYTRHNIFDSTEFRAGTHVYVLTLRIPPNCPSSCKGPYGYIAYHISLTIDKPWSFDETFRKPLTVVQSLDLNYNPEFAMPIKDECIKYYCRWPCTSGPIYFALYLPYGGFVPEQEIPFLVEVDNQSPHYDIEGVEASLRQHYVFLSRKPHKRNYYTKVLTTSLLEERTLRLTKKLYESSVLVPEDTPRSTLNHNYIIYLYYTVHVSLKTGCFHYDGEVAVPVVIGTVPLRNSSNLVTTQPTARSGHRGQMPALAEAEDTSDVANEDRDVAAEERERANDDPPSYASCLPPSFSFATLGSQQTLDTSVATGTSNNRQQEQTGLRVQLPKFPSYNTFAAAPQPINISADSVFDQNISSSQRSLFTNETGRSLDTFGSSLPALSEDEDIFDDDDNV